ncbi:hypothetical protein BIW11_05609 [Tropilaelaps mercedesae]|uniref:Uncharacterized protein n=1 Tax=Tropilaelaps mercedesae TaxID=418985 RepID=A0A1V9Y1K1_9ACAR|nr:hypothetical protein BIW11_05609 [Tropilaelaps mercedesae]
MSAGAAALGYGNNNRKETVQCVVDKRKTKSKKTATVEWTTRNWVETAGRASGLETVVLHSTVSKKDTKGLTTARKRRERTKGEHFNA